MKIDELADGFWCKFLCNVFIVYIITCVITSSSLFSVFRKYVVQVTPFFKFESYPHFIDCRLCVGFWISFFYCLFVIQDLRLVLPIYGASYLLATQER